MSNINWISNNPNVDISKQAGGLCKIILRNTPRVSDKAYCNCQIRLFTIRRNRKKSDRGIKKL